METNGRTIGCELAWDGSLDRNHTFGRESCFAQTELGARKLNALLSAVLGSYEVPHAGLPLAPGRAEDVLKEALMLLGEEEVPVVGMGETEAFERVTRVLSRYGVQLSSRRTAAHLQPPPLAVAVAADAIASLGNGSVDTYDSGPAGIALEQWVVRALARLANLPNVADGVMTPGGSLSNLQGLLLARDRALLQRGFSPGRDGARAFSNPRVFCSEVAHFSIQRAAGAIGLGESAVIPVPVDLERRMCTRALEAALDKLRPEETLVAIVATAGTTDFGSIDPLRELAGLAKRRDTWFHVDAAYGFGALFSEHLAPRLQGIELADSITLDLHKIGWQPAAASFLLVSHQKLFHTLEREVAYLNPKDDSRAGLDGLLGRSLQTTRRSDAAKVVATLLAFGTRGLGEMVDACHQLALHAESVVRADNRLALVSGVNLTTVVFRYVPRVNLAAAQQDAVNGALRRILLESGQALIGRTAAFVDGPSRVERTCLKLTILNPAMVAGDIEELLSLVVWAGKLAEEHVIGGLS